MLVRTHCACALRTSLLFSLRVPRFSRRRYTNFAAADTAAAGNDFVLLRCITIRRCCWQACTVSINDVSQQSTPLRDIDSCKNSKPARRMTDVAAYLWRRSYRRFIRRLFAASQSASRMSPTNGQRVYIYMHGYTGSAVPSCVGTLSFTHHGQANLICIYGLLSFLPLSLVASIHRTTNHHRANPDLIRARTIYVPMAFTTESPSKQIE